MEINREIINQISDEWDLSGVNLIKPKVLIGRYNNKIYYTMSDNESIVFFLSDNGKQFAASKSECKIITIKGIKMYNIEGEDSFIIVGCSIIKKSEGIFVKSHILPLISSTKRK